MSFDLSIIGIVFAIILLIIFFSAVVLYLAFRIKETFRKEKRKGFTIVKIGFLIGILFLAGGIFYFFANTLGNIPQSNPVPEASSSPYLNLTVSNQPAVTPNTIFVVSFTVINPTEATAHGATIQANLFFVAFEIQSSTHEVLGNVVNIGDVAPGTTIVALELLAPNKPGTVSDKVNLLYQEMIAPVIQEITISVQGGSTETPFPTPSPTPPATSFIPPDFSIAYPSAVSVNTAFTMSFTIRNTNDITIQGATIEAKEVFANFAIVSSTREIVGNVVNLGEVPPGTTIIALELLSSSKPGTVSDTVSLLYQEMTAPVTQQVTISVRGGGA
jgi:hypothetical protein